MTPRDLTGKVFGCLVALRMIRGGRLIRWECLCDPVHGGCGATTTKYAQNLISRTANSCGCQYRTSLGHASRARDGGQSPEYRTWNRMIYRCEDAKCVAFFRYGGRGIKVCSRWRESFAAFLADMGPRPSNKHSIDRINGDGDYEPNNCRWATRVQQARNVKTNCRLTARGETRCLVEWIPVASVTANAIRSRIKAGWSHERAIFEPAIKGVRLDERVES